jgi:hypothetical protein|tara:strand:+ start:3410 stop:3568 length:159 start_codon:yes stop_codon:yes gene_type:complete
MIELLEFIEDLKMLEALDPVGREAHIERLLEKYQTRADEVDAEISKQMELGF